MSVSASTGLVDDVNDYPLHEEDDVPEGSLHRRRSGYLDDVLEARFPGWFVSGNVWIYWEPRSFTEYVAPDVFLAGGHVPDPPPRVYRSWLLPPLRFAAEIGSFATAQRGAKLGEYAAHRRPSEVLYTEPVNEEAGEMLVPEKVHLYRWTGTVYEEVEPLPSGRLRSEVLALEIGVNEDRNLRAYTLEGEPLLYYPESEQARVREARARAEAEQRAEQLARERLQIERERQRETAARAQAERRAEQSNHDRLLAEQAREREVRARAQAEQARIGAERRLAEERARREALEAQLAELQARQRRESETP